MTLPKIASRDEWLAARKEHQNRWSRRATLRHAEGPGNDGDATTPNPDDLTAEVSTSPLAA